jgi:transcriptional regulator with XRE-family HTH domain
MEVVDSRSLFARNLKKYRLTLRFSQKALAGLVGCSTTLIGNIEIKKRFPSVDTLDRIAKALNVKVADLFTEKPETIQAIVSREELKTRLEKGIATLINEIYHS